MNLSRLFLVFLSIMSMTAYAHGPTPRKVDKSIVIDAPIEKVWVVVKQFDRIADWHPDVLASEGDGKNQSGSERRLTLKTGILTEGLDYISDADHEYNYRLSKENTDAFPVSSYSAAIQLVAEGDKTKVKWKSRFYRGDTSNNPPKRLNDEAAVKAMNQFVQNGLEGLKKAVEK
ncbi:SRPBCC family protein [methane-oxidizing endosymbiont of Gigantopelta aegis]|uniref:SRPBCC family protein n=1 Tax=methane-oxidizing endosymbiont of Gigantopelta aegis TaxID=2794938 RepID=UPI0018DDACE1|nr:SRPBCC family protein [methane-oxidizing endosymbiont of Gigantopelta aegis]